MSSFSTFLPRIALRTSAVYTSSLPRLYRLTSKSVDPSTSSSSSSSTIIDIPTNSEPLPFDITSPPPPKDRSETGLESPPSIPAWPSSSFQFPPSASSSSSSTPQPTPKPSLIPPLDPKSYPSDLQARKELFRAHKLARKQAAREAHLASLSPSEAERYLQEQARADRFHSLSPEERAEEIALEKRQAYEAREAYRATLTPVELAEEDARRQAQAAYIALSPAEKKKWKVAERERVMTEGKTDLEKQHYLSIARYNRNLAKFGVQEMARRKKAKEIKNKWGVAKVKEKVFKEDKRKGIHGLQARNERAGEGKETSRGGGGARGGGHAGGSGSSEA